MLKSKLPNSYHTLQQHLAEASIQLKVTRKKVKNINFRIKPNILAVSVPLSIPDIYAAKQIEEKLSWAIQKHNEIMQKQRKKQSEPLMLWGEPQSFVMSDAQKLAWYRQQLQERIPELFDKWQKIVGKTANEARIRKMHTRWGTCNIRAKRVWLSVYLPKYPIECTEYVIVHELCHLHHANHSKSFWQQVAKAMPDYKQWHDMLAGKIAATDID